MDHRSVSLQFLRSTGLIPVKVRPGQKDPFPEFDPRRAASENHKETLLALERNKELNLGALFHGRYVDIDIDTKEQTLMAALDYFLPNTPYTWGRPSKPRSHRVYTLHEDFDRGPYGNILRYIKKLVDLDGRSYSVEVRGGKAENGLFTVLPGSYRGDVEELVEWAGEFDPTVSGAIIPTWRLLKSVRLAIAAGVLANYWIEGARNDLSLALSGLMWRIRANSMAAMGFDVESEAEEHDFFLREADAKALLQAVMVIGGDDENDQRSRTLNFVNTWKKLDNDASAKVTGGKVVAELIGGEGDKIVKALYRLLSDNDGIEQMEALAEQFVVWYGQGVLIDTQMVAVGRDNPFMNREQANNSLGNRKITIGDKKVPMATMLFQSPLIPRVAGLTFDPSTTERIVSTEQGAMVNQWRGFAVEPCTQTVTDDEVQPFLDYIGKVVANGNTAAADWVLAWCADLFRHPAEKPGTALVLVGVQGAGKTFLGERVLGAIIGKGHYTQMNSIETLTNKFNTIVDNKVFVQCDEAIHSYQKDAASRLKSIITDETMTVEPKGINSYKKPNHMRLLFTSNEESTAMFIDPTPHERRFTVLKVSDHKAADIEYWTFMHQWTKMNLPKVLRWLQDYKYDRRLIKRPIDTDAKRQLQKIGLDPEISWIISRCAMGFPLAEKWHNHWFEAFDAVSITDNEKKADTLRRDVWPTRVLLPTIEADFRSYVREHGRSVYSGSILTSIRRALPVDAIIQQEQITVSYPDQRTGQTIKNRIRLYSWPTKEMILDHLRAKFGEVVDQVLQESENEIVTSEPEVTVPEDEEAEF